jgi:hypothetical protein
MRSYKHRRVKYLYFAEVSVVDSCLEVFEHGHVLSKASVGAFLLHCADVFSLEVNYTVLVASSLHISQESATGEEGVSLPLSNRFGVHILFNLLIIMQVN